jgi:hypothetical protein
MIAWGSPEPEERAGHEHRQVHAVARGDLLLTEVPPVEARDAGLPEAGVVEKVPKLG